MANLKMKRVPIPVKYELKVKSIATHMPVIINVVSLDCTNGIVWYMIPEDKKWRQMSMEKYKLLYQPWKKLNYPLKTN